MSAALGFGRRLYIRRRRVHHGLTGAVLVVIGIVLMLDDRDDFPWRFCVEQPAFRER